MPLVVVSIAAWFFCRLAPICLLSHEAMRVPSMMTMLVYRDLELTHFQTGVLKAGFKIVLLIEHPLSKVRMVRSDMGVNRAIRHENADIDRAKVGWFQVQADALQKLGMSLGLRPFRHSLSAARGAHVRRRRFG